MKLKLRPFDRTLDFAGAEYRCSATLTQIGITVRIGESQFDISGDKGEDEFGAFVLADPVEAQLPFNFVFRLEPEFEEGEDPGAAISLKQVHPMGEELQRQNQQFNVVVPPISSATLHFHSSGVFDGWSGGGSTERPSTAVTH